MMTALKKTGLVAGLIASGAGCASTTKKKADPRLGIDLTAMDASVRPQDDFFRYVNGGWLKTFVMPDDKSIFGAFHQLHDDSELSVKRIIQGLSKKKNKTGTNQQRIADFYRSFMDEKRVESLGAKPIRAELAAIERISSKNELVDWFGKAQSRGVDSPLGFGVRPDKKDVGTNIVYIAGSGLGLPDRDYYFKKDDRSKAIREAYLAFASRALELVGEEDSREKAKAVYAVEKSIAKHHWTRVQRRDADKTYNKTPFAKLGANVKRHLKAAGVPASQKNAIVIEPSYLSALPGILKGSSIADWKLYAKVRVLEARAMYLSKDFVDAAFAYSGKALSGQPEIRARWKRGVALVNGAVGEAVGEVYVKRHFPASSKKRMVELVENLRAAYRERIKDLAWMGEETKKKAFEKLEKFNPKIGYPNKWKDYSKLSVKADDLVGNVKRSTKVEYDRMLAKLNKPVDRDEWHMLPQTVNAYFNPTLNEIVFPAAILRPPFFNPKADDAVNYGGIGAVIGHEMGHGFDDQGSKYDGDGYLKNWWTKKDRDSFKKRTALLIEQFSEFEPLPGERVNGELTQGENIGDLGGLSVAHRAYELSLNGTAAPKIEGFTGDQRFFLGWGQVWRSAIRDKALSVRLATDPHSPAEYRVNGVVRNMPEFYRAFSVGHGDGLYLPDERRVSIW
jgi:predicted metalloendopeptidase